jgi:hypothetical protein
VNNFEKACLLKPARNEKKSIFRKENEEAIPVGDENNTNNG